MGSSNSIILIVDDEPAGRHTLESILEGQGYDLVMAENGTQAIEKAKQVLPDVILLDVMMPGMDGFELNEELQKIDSKVNVCFLTASELYYKEFRKKEYYALDKDLFIRKPVEDEELLKEINRLIR